MSRCISHLRANSGASGAKSAAGEAGEACKNTKTQIFEQTEKYLSICS